FQIGERDARFVQGFQSPVKAGEAVLVRPMGAPGKVLRASASDGRPFMIRVYRWQSAEGDAIKYHLTLWTEGEAKPIGHHDFTIRQNTAKAYVGFEADAFPVEAIEVVLLYRERYRGLGYWLANEGARLAKQDGAGSFEWNDVHDSLGRVLKRIGAEPLVRPGAHYAFEPGYRLNLASFKNDGEPVRITSREGRITGESDVERDSAAVEPLISREKDGQNNEGPAGGVSFGFLSFLGLAQLSFPMALAALAAAGLAVWTWRIKAVRREAERAAAEMEWAGAAGDLPPEEAARHINGFLAERPLSLGVGQTFTRSDAFGGAVAGYADRRLKGRFFARAFRQALAKRGVDASDQGAIRRFVAAAVSGARIYLVDQEDLEANEASWVGTAAQLKDYYSAGRYLILTPDQAVADWMRERGLGGSVLLKQDELFRGQNRRKVLLRELETDSRTRRLLGGFASVRLYASPAFELDESGRDPKLWEAVQILRGLFPPLTRGTLERIDRIVQAVLSSA
ncbi:MAG: hypothetical protein ACT4O3_04670, partial [Elusimicrobiota bacterium]